MNLHFDYHRLQAFCVFFIILLQYSDVSAETLCVDSTPMASPKMLTSIDYPAMVTTAQCQCMIIPAQPIEELNIQVQLRRSDRTTDCSRTQMTIVYHNLSNIICPTVDGQLMSGGNKNNRSSMTISLSLTKNDRPVITMWNTHLEFINAQVIITSEHPVPYNIVCTNIEGSLYWPFEDQGLGFDDGIDSGIKIAVVVLFFILAVLLSALIRLIVRLRWRRAQFESKKQQARLKRISKLKQATAFDNLGFSSSTLSHSSSNTLILHYSGKPNHNGNLLVIPTADSTSRSTVGSTAIAPQNITGHGCIWPLEEDEPHQPMVNRPTQDMSNGFIPNRTSKPVKVYYANDVSVSASGGRETPLSRYYQAPSTSSHEAQTATISHLTYRNSLPDALAPTLIGSEEEQHGQAACLSDVPLALVHQRGEPGKSWQKNSRNGSRKFHMENNGKYQKTFDNDTLLNISTNTTHRSNKTNGIMPTANHVYDTFSAQGNLSMTGKDRMPRESAI